jgi:hypothetical protein
MRGFLLAYGHMDGEALAESLDLVELLHPANQTSQSFAQMGRNARTGIMRNADFWRDAFRLLCGTEGNG